MKHDRIKAQPTPTRTPPSEELIEFVKALARADANRDYEAAIARQRGRDSETHAHPDLRPI
ncbi:hypothetical protein [Sphingomonas sp. BAUL-RG-20F-R05-02]|uniref:hypothetical protein n=1 Tax=Sphingomonas sp. BAUL-RG-20F-R05-02 TaxID=2914830 RepID=UPI001F5A7FE0|nr:hypothetical protein [Sphingomonas sp. BAUL-RG-20F-R05-02]